MEEMGLAAKEGEENDVAGLEELIDHLGRLLADEYVVLMKRNQEEENESSDLCPVFERESKAREH